MTEFRPLVRIRQALSEEECLTILKTQKRGVLSVNGDNGYPYGMPLKMAASIFMVARSATGPMH